MDNWELPFLFLTRGLYIVLVGVSLAAVPHVFDLLNEEFSGSGSTLYVPLQICRPNIIEIDGLSYTIEGDNGCISLNLLVSACAASLVLSIIAVVVFLGVDLFTRWKNTHRTMAVGMGLFLCFILMQAAFCAGSLAREVQFIEDLYNDYIDAAGDSVPWSSASAYGSVKILKATMVLGFFSSFVVLVESIYIIFWVTNKEDTSPRLMATKADSTLTPNKKPDSSTSTPTTTDVESPTIVGPTKSTSSQFPTWSNVD